MGTAESIKASFQPFFEDTWLGEDIDVNIVYKYLNELKNFHLWSDDTEEKKLSKQAKNSDVNMFSQNIFPKISEKIAQACYVQQMDSFAKLFEEKSFYNRVGRDG